MKSKVREATVFIFTTFQTRNKYIYSWTRMHTYFIKNMVFIFICSNEADVDGGDRPSGHDGPSRWNSQPSQKRSKAPQALESLLHKNISEMH